MRGAQAATGGELLPCEIPAKRRFEPGMQTTASLVRHSEATLRACSQAMFRVAIGLAGLLLLAACATVPQIEPDLLSQLAPSGKIRVGINYGNVILASRDPASGELRGVHVDLARELGRRVGVPVELVGYAAAAPMVESLKSGALDVAFLSAEPARATEINFTPAYAVIDATYLVPAGSPIRAVTQVDREGARIAVADQSAYDFFLRRTLQRARLVRAPGTHGAYELFKASKLDALVGLRPRLVADSAMLPGSRVLEDRFMAIEQTIASAQGRDGAAALLREFVEDAKASGLVAAAIENNGVRGVAVAPRARLQ